MNERLKQLAEQAGLHIASNREGRALVFGNQVHVHVLFDEIERFADLVRQDEREACAKLCEKFIPNFDDGVFFAKVIRARGEK